MTESRFALPFSSSITSATPARSASTVRRSPEQSKTSRLIRTTLAALAVVLGMTATLAGCSSAPPPTDPDAPTSAASRAGRPAGTADEGTTASDASDAVDLATPATLHPGDEIPAPTGRVVLVIRGGSATNAAGELRLDRELLEAMGTVDLSVDDRFATGENATFRGPLLRTVLDVAGAGDATTLHTIALNDYIADLPVSDASNLPLIVATRMNGKPMSVANYGPTRFIYPTDAGLDAATYEPRWVWQLATIELQ
jgi:hypothetical protein